MICKINFFKLILLLNFLDEILIFLYSLYINSNVGFPYMYSCLCFKILFALGTNLRAKPQKTPANGITSSKGLLLNILTAINETRPIKRKNSNVILGMTETTV